LRIDSSVDLVELMDPEDPARVLAGGSRLAPEAGREAGVAERQILLRQDLVVVERRQGHLGGADQVQVVVGQAVDLLLGIRQEAGPVEGALAHEHGRHHGLESLAAEPLQRKPNQRELEHHEVPEQVGKPRPRQPRAPFHVDPVAGELEMVLAGGAGFPDLVEHRVLRRGVLGGQIRQRGQLAVPFRVYRRLRIAQLATTGGHRRELLALLGRRRPLAALGGAVLLGAQLLELGRDRAPALIKLEHAVDGIGRRGAPPAQGGAHRVRFASDQLNVEHGSLAAALVRGRHSIRASS
jgi:hypothetical protein